MTLKVVAVGELEVTDAAGEVETFFFFLGNLALVWFSTKVLVELIVVDEF